jgi:orotidine-5'-phosphate decarboxylase
MLVPRKVHQKQEGALGNSIILALDLHPPHMDAIISIAADLKPYVYGFKLGAVLDKLPGAAGCIATRHAPVMVDRKFHNTPDVMEAEAAAFQSASIITVQASAGIRGIQAARRGAPKAVIAAVTVMTSMSDKECLEIYRHSREDLVVHFAEMAVRAGAGAIVCAGRDLRMLRRKSWMGNIKIITPGIRLPDDPIDDHVHTMTPGDAIYNGADYIVVGRSVTKCFQDGLSYHEATRQAIEHLAEIKDAVDRAYRRLAFAD